MAAPLQPDFRDGLAFVGAILQILAAPVFLILGVALLVWALLRAGL
jgi:hypothetical protein